MYTLILIDCWDFSKISIQGVLSRHTPQIEKNIMEFTHHLEIDNVVFASYECEDTSPVLLDHYESIGKNVYNHVCTVPELFDLTNVTPNTQFVIGGQAFTHCLHHRPLGFLSMLEQKLFVHSHPKLTDAYESNSFSHDKMLEWKSIGYPELLRPTHKLGFVSYVAMMENFVRDVSNETLGKFFRESWPASGEIWTEDAQVRIKSPIDPLNFHSRKVHIDLRRLNLDFTSFLGLMASFCQKNPNLAFNISEQHKTVIIRFPNVEMFDYFAKYWDLTEYTVVSR